MAEIALRGRAVESRETAAVEDLYSTYSSRVYGYCLRELGSPEEAEDALQETYLNAWTSLRRGVRPESPLPWLLRIAANLCISRYRARAARPRTQALDEAEDLLVGPDPSHDELFALSDALAELPELQRRAFVLREWRGLSYGEVAAELGLSNSAVATHIFRGRRALAAALGRELGRPARDRLRSLGLAPLLAGLQSLFPGAASVKIGTGLAVLATIGVTAAPELEPAPASERPERLATASAPEPIPAPPASTPTLLPAEPVRAEASALAPPRDVSRRAGVGTAVSSPTPPDPPLAPAKTGDATAGERAVGTSSTTGAPAGEPSATSSSQSIDNGQGNGLALGHNEEQGQGNGQANTPALDHDREQAKSNGNANGQASESANGQGGGNANGQGNGNANGHANDNANGQANGGDQGTVGPGNHGGKSQGNGSSQGSDSALGEGDGNANGQGNGNANGHANDNANGQDKGTDQSAVSQGDGSGNGQGHGNDHGKSQGNTPAAGPGSSGGNSGGGSGQGAGPKK